MRSPRSPDPIRLRRWSGPVVLATAWGWLAMGVLGTISSLLLLREVAPGGIARGDPAEHEIGIMAKADDPN